MFLTLPSLVMPRSSKRATIHNHSSRGCKIMTCKSWRSKKVKLPPSNSSQASQIYLIKCSLEPKISDFLFRHPTLIGHSFAAPWPMMMHSSSLKPQVIFLGTLLKTQGSSTFKVCNLGSKYPYFASYRGHWACLFWLALIIFM